MMNKSLLIERIEECTRRIGIPAWGIVVCQEHRELLRYTSGFADVRKTVPFTAHHVCWLYSLTKLATCTAAVRLIEDGKLSLDDEVSKYLPAFRNPMVVEHGRLRAANRPITVLDLFTMRAGLNYDLDGLYSEADSDLDTIAKLAARPLDFDPGERFQYSLCHDMLAGVIAVAAQMPYPEWLQQALFAPLDMNDTRFIASAKEREPFCAQYLYANGTAVPCDMENKYVLSKRYHSGGAGLTTTLEDYHKLVDALANDGIGANGAQILKPQSIRMLCQNRLSPEQTAVMLAWRPDYGYGLGVRTRVQDASNPRHYVEFGWDGAAGGFALADTTNRLSLLYLQHVLDCEPAFSELHHLLRDTMYEALGLL